MIDGEQTEGSLAAELARWADGPPSAGSTYGR